jgi:hypothetical protein
MISFNSSNIHIFLNSVRRLYSSTFYQDRWTHQRLFCFAYKVIMPIVISHNMKILTTLVGNLETLGPKLNQARIKYLMKNYLYLKQSLVSLGITTHVHCTTALQLKAPSAATDV